MAGVPKTFTVQEDLLGEDAVHFMIYFGQVVPKEPILVCGSNTASFTPRCSTTKEKQKPRTTNSKIGEVSDKDGRRKQLKLTRLKIGQNKQNGISQIAKEKAEDAQPKRSKL